MAELLKPGQGPLDYGKRRWLQAVFAVTLFVLYLPIFVLIAYSFNLQNRSGVWKGFTLENYTRLFSSALYFRILLRTVRIALMTSLFAALFAYPLAIAIARGMTSR